MKKRLWLGGLLALCCGCDSMNNTEGGALGGGLLGGALGTIIGAAAHAPLAGAAIGAAAGAGTGALIGNSEDRAQARADRRAAAIAAQYPPPSLYDIKDMSQRHISDAIIINQIRVSGANYSLTPNDIAWLKEQGVSDVVVMEMQTRRPVVVRDPYYGPVYYPAPGPVVGVGVGVGR